MRVDKKIAKARAALIMAQPFFGTIALKLKIEQDLSTESTWTDGITLGYNPEYVEKLTMDEIKSMVAKPVMQIALGHHLRRNGRSEDTWKQSSNGAIEPVLKDSGFYGQWDEQYRDLSAEQVYKRIFAEKQENDQGNGQGNKGDKNQNGNSQGQGNKGDKNKPGQSEVRDYPGDKAEGEIEQKTTLAQAAQASRACGKGSSLIDRLVDEMLKPKVDWRDYLHSFVQQAAKNDYTWTPPNRRHIHRGMYLPSCKSMELGEIAVGIDTSGSVKASELAEIAAELTNILETYPSATLKVVYCNTNVTGSEEFDQQTLPVKLNCRGGGGTKFTPVFDYIDKGEQPIALIYFTDLCCNDFPSKAPEYPVLWAKVGDDDRTAPWGQLVPVDI